MKIKCKHCGQEYEVDESMTGSSAECEVCAGKFVITPIIESESVPPVTVMAEVENEDDNLILGLYRLEGEVAEGGMGKVYRVHHTSWNVDLAMKQPHAHMFETQAQKDTFAHECDAWINLGLHPHIVSCYYVREIDGIPSIFAEWMEGGDLTHAVRDGKIDSLERILDIAIQFAWGLDYAHEQGLIHQDVKPENVMFDSEGNIKVTDFGIANAKRDIGISTSMTAQFDGTMISEAGAYTPAYCSPEQANKDKLTKRTDIWSWAVSMLEMFLCERLWESGVVAGLACEDYFESVKVPIPESVKDLLRNCFKENEAERPHDFKTIADKLLEIYESEIGAPFKRTEPVSAEDTPESLNNRALSYIDMGQEEKVDDLWQQALEKDLHHFETTYNQGRHLWHSGKIDDMELVRRLEELRQFYTGSWRDEYLLAMIHLDRNDRKEALTLLENAAESADNHPDVIYAVDIAKSIDDRQHTFEGHTDYVDSVAFSPDGKFALSGSVDETLKLWEVDTGKCLRTFEGHIGSVDSVAFSPDGKFALSTSGDNTLKLWEVDTGECLRTFEGHIGSVDSVAFSPDGKFALSGSWDKTLKLWNIDTGECLRIFEGHTYYVFSVAFSPDGRFALSGSGDKTMKLWDIDTGECLRTFEGHTNRVRSIAFSPDGKLALSGSWDKTLKLWNIDTGECLRTFKGHTAYVPSIAFSPDGKFALSGSDDKMLKFWDIASGQCLRTFEGHTGGMSSVAFSPDGKFALSGSLDGTLKLWNLFSSKKYSDWELCKVRSTSESIELEQRFQTAYLEAKQGFEAGNVSQALDALEEASEIPGFKRMPQLLNLKYQLGGLCRISALNSYMLKVNLEGAGLVNSVAFSPDGRLALSDSRDDPMKLWDVKTGKCLRTFEEHNWQVSSVAFSPDGKFALSGSWDKTLKLWDINTGECLRTFKGHTGYVFSVAFSPDGKFVLSGSNDNTLKLWYIANGQCLRTFEDHWNNCVKSVTFSPDAKQALSGSNDKTLKLWDIAKGQCLRTFKGHKREVNSVAFSLDGGFALSGSRDKTLKLWNVDTGGCVRTFEEHTDEVSSVTFSPDGKFALSGSRDKTLKLWDINTGECLRTVEGHTHWVSSVAFSTDGKFAFSGSKDRTLKLWQFDWEYEFPGWADWDDGAEPYLKIFLTLHPEYTDDDVQKLLTELQYRGYGWLRPEGVRKKLKMVVDSVEPHLRNFLILHTIKTKKGIFKREKIETSYTEEDVQKLLTELQNRGYGWLRPEGVRKKLDEMKNT